MPRAQRVQRVQRVRVLGFAQPGDRPVRYDLLPTSHLRSFMPRTRAHDLDYEAYVPSGLLKAGWVQKHSETYPALVVFTISIDNSRTLDWGALDASVAGDLRELKDNVKDRGIDVAVVIIENAPIVLASETRDHRELLGERLMRFVAACCCVCLLLRL
jgi:hypothetical protein